MRISYYKVLLITRNGGWGGKERAICAYWLHSRSYTTVLLRVSEVPHACTHAQCLAMSKWRRNVPEMPGKAEGIVGMHSNGVKISVTRVGFLLHVQEYVPYLCEQR